MSVISFYSGLNLSFDLLNDNFEDDSTLSKFEANVFTSWRHLTQLSHRVETLLGRDNHTPLASILLLKQLD